MLTWTPPLDWTPPDVISGQFARLERLRPDHGPLLWPSMMGHPEVWTWLLEGPFEQESAYRAHIEDQAAATETCFYAIGGELGWAGVSSFLRIDRDVGSIEIGNLCFSPKLQRSRVATEAIMLMAQTAFQAGFRRLEWKCNAQNIPSRRAAIRFGFAFEGVFRQHNIVKGRNRDTAWFAILDGEWPALRRAYEAWLDHANFDAEGRQIEALSDLTQRVVDRLKRPGIGGPLGA